MEASCRKNDAEMQIDKRIGMMEKRNNLQNKIKVLMCGMCLVLTGCSTIGLAQNSTFESAYENVPEEEKVDIYTSQSTVVIESVDESKQEVTAFLTERNESRTFTYNGASTISDKYGNPMSMAQLQPGDIADVAYNSELERIGRIQLTADSWSQENIAKYTMNIKKESVSIGGETYSLGKNVKAFSDGQAIELTEILHNDVLTFHGRGNSILSITVDKGHGYLDMVNEDGFVGGWIEVGQTVICEIQQDMLITIPEGTYTVRLTSSGIEEVREVTINRNKETTLNLGDVEFPQPDKGRVVFNITPEDADIYVDDELIDTTYTVKLPLGMHLVTAEASGYDTLSQYFKVEGETTTIKMKLSETAAVSDNDIDSEETEEEEETEEVPQITIKVDQENVEVYQDNLYKGIAPVSYDKTAGTHTITLRKSGYVTRSYEIQVEDDEIDVTYTFSALDPESSTGTVSDNSTDDDDDDKGKDDNGKGNDDDKSGKDKKDDSVSDNSVSDNSVSDNTVSGN